MLLLWCYFAFSVHSSHRFCDQYSLENQIQGDYSQKAAIDSKSGSSIPLNKGRIEEGDLWIIMAALKQPSGEVKFNQEIQSGKEYDGFQKGASEDIWGWSLITKWLQATVPKEELPKTTIDGEGPNAEHCLLLCKQSINEIPI